MCTIYDTRDIVTKSISACKCLRMPFVPLKVDAIKVYLFGVYAIALLGYVSYMMIVVQVVYVITVVPVSYVMNMIQAS